MPVSALNVESPLGSPLGTLLVTAMFLLVGLVLAIVGYRRAPRRNTTIAIIALAVGFATVSGVFGYAAYRSYVVQNTWGFGYGLTIQGNGTAPETIVVPIAKDEGLLAGLRLSSGTANWTFVDTPKGRGLFVRFTGSARIETSVSTFPRPAAPPDTSPTMVESSNCTAQPSNCTGPPRLWIYYSGAAGARVGLTLDPWYLGGYLETGWASYEVWPLAVP